MTVAYGGLVNRPLVWVLDRLPISVRRARDGENVKVMIHQLSILGKIVIDRFQRRVNRELYGREWETGRQAIYQGGRRR